MARRLAHPAGTQVPARGTGSVTTDRSARATDGAGGDADLFGDVEPELRLRMELVARASASPDAALPYVVALLVEGDERRAAIVEAFATNDALREQWHRTWEVLRR